MTDATRYDRIQWHEGMLLSPHHFQSQDERGQMITSFHLKHGTPFFWGVRILSIDRNMLMNGRVRVNEIEGVMPDGLIFSHRIAGGIRELELDLEDWTTDNPDAFDHKAVHIFIAVPRSQEDGDQLKGMHPRYRSIDTHNIIDINTGEGATSIPRLKPNLQLFAGDVLPAHLTGFPIMRLSKEGDAYVPDPFQAPALSITPESDIGVLIDQLIVQLRQKITFLSQQILSHMRSAASKEAEEAIKLLASGMLQLDGLNKVGCSDSFTLYQSLLTLAGHAWGIEPSAPLPNFQPYNHDDAFSSFMEVLLFIRRMIDRIQEGYQVLTMTPKGRQFTLFLEHKWLEKQRLIIGVRASHTMKPAQLIDWIMQAVIASASAVNHAREKRIRGAERRLIDGVKEMKLYPPRGMILAEITVDPQQIRTEEDLVIFNVDDADDTRPVEIVLYTEKEDVETDDDDNAHYS